MTVEGPLEDEGGAAGDPEARPEVGHELVGQVREALAVGDIARVEALLLPLHPADLADLLEWLGGDLRPAVLDIILPKLDPELLPELEDPVREAVLERLAPEELAAAVAELDSDDAVEVVGDLDAAEQQQVLEAMPVGDRVVIEEALGYPEDSAGRLMQRELVAVPEYWTVGEVIDFLRVEEGLPDDFYDLFIVDPKHRPVGTIPLSRVLRTTRPVAVGEIMEPEYDIVPVNMDQEDVAHLFRQRDLVSTPVVDESGRLVGVITVDDVVDVIDDEAEEDFMRLAGVREDDIFRAVGATLKARFAWLVVNLATAVAASVVIGFFEATIEQRVALAVLMPIVASMGGNAGTQTVTVAVRALAMKELTPANAANIIRKEVLVGGCNGIVFALFSSAVAVAWFGDWAIGGVMALAMVANLMVAGLAGTTIPLGLALMKIDPAVASGVFLTTITDVIGFFVFLGLAAWLIL